MNKDYYNNDKNNNNNNNYKNNKKIKQAKSQNDLENLNKKYNELLNDYQKSVADYINYLKENPNNSENSEMITISNSAYWGTGALSQNNLATIEECKAACSDTEGCMGATFNGVSYEQPICWLRTGESDVVTGLPEDYAIVPKGKQLILNVQNINKQLLQMNQEIRDKENNAQALYILSKDKSKNANRELIKDFLQLNEERNNIDKLLTEVNTLEQTKQEEEIVITKNHYWFFVLVGIVIVILIILYKIGVSDQKQNVPNVIQQGGSWLKKYLLI